jgi:hypothetical protein
MTTVRELITGSLKLIGVVQKSEPITADEAQDGLDRLNELVESWANDSLMIYSRTWENFTLNGGDGEYTIGTSGDFNTTRPTQIISAYVRVGDIDYPLTQLTDDQYALYIAQKNLQSNIPEYFNFDNGFPLAKIRIWQVPSAQCTLYMQSEKQVTSFASIDTDIVLPPGWMRALRYNLAVELAPEYDAEISQAVAVGAAESKGILKSQVLKNRPLTYMPSVIGFGYDIMSDTYR